MLPFPLLFFARAAVLRAAAKNQLYHTAIKKSIANLHKLSIFKILKFVQYSDLRILKNFCIIYLQGKGKKKLTGQVFRLGRMNQVGCLIEKV